MSSQTNKPEIFVAELNARVPLDEQILRGQYNYINPAITTRKFKLTISAGKREIVLYDPRGFVSSKEMIRRMKPDGCVAAVIDDCLAIGQQFPNRQRRNPIVFLGTVCRDAHGNRRVPVLDCWDGERKLDLAWFDDDWNDVCRFAAVREK